MNQTEIYISTFTLGAYFMTVLGLGFQYCFDILRLRGYTKNPMQVMCGIAMLLDATSIITTFILLLIKPSWLMYGMCVMRSFDTIVAYAIVLVGETILLDAWPSRKLFLTQVIPLMLLFILQIFFAFEWYNIPGYLMMVELAIIFGRQIYYMYRHDKGLRNYYSNIEGRTTLWYLNICLFVMIEALGWSLFNLFGLTSLIFRAIYNVYMTIFWIAAARFIWGQVHDSQDRAMLESAMREDEKFESGADTDKEGDIDNRLLPCTQVQALMEEEKLYLQTDINIATLAQRLNTNRTYLSHYFNRVLGTTFYDYINGFRLQEAEKMLSNEEVKIETIAYACGFSSSTSFIRVFQRSHGCSPTQWRKNQLTVNG